MMTFLKTLRLFGFLGVLMFNNSTLQAQNTIEADLDSIEHYLNEGEFTPAYLYSMKALKGLKSVPADDIEFRYKAYQKFIQVINHGIDRMSSPDARQLLYRAEYQTYETTIGLAYELFKQTNDLKYMQYAFDLVERNRNVLFLQSIKGNENLNIGGVPDSILAEESWYIAEIKQLNDSLSIYKETLNHTIHPIIDRLESEKNKLELEFDTFRIANAELYKNFNSITARKKKISIKNIQQQLHFKDAFIEYFYGDKYVYAFLIAKHHLRFIRLSPTPITQQSIVNFKNSLHRDEMRFVQTSSDLYQQLFQPLYHSLKNVKNITIVADGALSYLPFDAFLTKSPENWNYDFSTLDYLIYHFQINYQQSATSYLYPKPLSSNRKKALALAPLFTESVKKRIPNTDSLYLALNPLLASKALLKNIQRLYHTDVLIGTSATASNFLNYKNAPLLHFATHTLVNEISPLESKIALARSDTSDNGYLLLKDLYQMSLDAELVVLGSCETGEGVFSRGEGMVSLAYGFDLAGANSTVYSLWAVDERATVDLMRLFYQNLAKGWNKDKALHEAKIQYLREANEVTSEPFYWASFVLNGDARPLQQVKPKRGNWWIWMIAFLGILGLGYFRFFRR